ncbi:hypothetical protein EK904_009290 [Melospiza melodia maxima]|nr:hypothetical protein EK904_009290 [Melospiza melodia maxima]
MPGAVPVSLTVAGVLEHEQIRHTDRLTLCSGRCKAAKVPENKPLAVSHQPKAVQKSQRDNCCAGELPRGQQAPRAVPAPADAAVCLLSVAVQLIQSALHEKRVQPVFKNLCAWSKAQRHI